MPRRLLLTAALPLLFGAAQAPSPPPSTASASAPAPAPPPMLTVKEVMRHVVNPAAELYWKAAGEVDSEDGAAKRVPKPGDDARWAAVVDAAAVLQESGALLKLPGRARDGDTWMAYSDKLAAAGSLALVAARARDEAKTFEAGSALYDACYACHGKYIPRPANSLYRQKTPDDAFKPPT